MDTSTVNPPVYSMFHPATVGILYTRCIVTAIVIVVLVYALHQAWRIIEQLRLFDLATKAHRAKETVAPYDAPKNQSQPSGEWR